MSDPLYNRRKDMDFFNSINNELINRIIQTLVVIYKINVETSSNIYGESNEKTYSKGIQIGCIITHEEQVTNSQDGFIPSVDQNIELAFHREMMNSRGFYPQIGDIVEWNESFYEIQSIVENQLIGGSQYKNFSIVCRCSMTNRDKLQLENVRVGKNI